MSSFMRASAPQFDGLLVAATLFGKTSRVRATSRRGRNLKATKYHGSTRSRSTRSSLFPLGSQVATGVLAIEACEPPAMPTTPVGKKMMRRGLCPGYHCGPDCGPNCCGVVCKATLDQLVQPEDFDDKDIDARPAVISL
eukprot:TRINITY_DN7535_c0_g1_i1.p1 TRINITY_DN7535_c0_g1~~TRINITY_DN7535_c0_g1_i1.p1  ORF type:complete len:139 (+),score=10.68 TRINITY_DN7535_c0_g1_i1:51-467(+)